jgi:hypothetical protein
VAALAVSVAGGAAVGATQVNNTPALLAFIGAIFVALITWYATDRRQARVIAADRERLEAQLAHDRELNDLSELRTVLDETLAAIEIHVHRLGRFHHARERAMEAGERFDALAEGAEGVSRITERARRLAETAAAESVVSEETQRAMTSLLADAQDLPDRTARIHRVNDEFRATTEAVTALSKEVEEAEPMFLATIGRLRLRLVDDPLFPAIEEVSTKVADLADAAVSSDDEEYRSATRSYNIARSAFVAAAATRVKVRV